VNDNVKIEAKLERLREYLREWALCDSRWRPVKGFPTAITVLTDRMKAGVADSSELRDGPNPWVMDVINAQLDNLGKRIPEARNVLLVRYLNKGGLAVFRAGRVCHLEQAAVDAIADLAEIELIPMVEREGLPL
jgi:hypothetical protein